MFEGRDLTCVRAERVVFGGLDFRMGPGDACLVTGRNGSGKSSLLRLMAGLIRPAAGELRWRGEPIAKNEVFLSEMHYVGHLDALKPALSAAENLSFWARLRGGDAIPQGLAAFGLAGLRDAPARILSAGQRRRLALARLIAAPAALWILDEPTVALDPNGIAALERALAAHRASGGLVVVSSNVPLGLPDAMTLSVEDFAVSDGFAEDLLPC